MDRIRKYFWIALAVLAAGCSKGERQEGGIIPGGGSSAGGVVPEGMVSTTLALAADGRLTPAGGTETKADTRASGPDETAVGDMWVLQFDTEASAEGSLIHRAYVPAQDIVQDGAGLKAPVMLRGSGSSVIVVVANAPESFTASVLPDGATLAELRTRTFAVGSTAGRSLPGDASVRLPMYGQTEPMAVSLTGSQAVSLDLRRLAARMNLTLFNHFTSGYPLLKLTSVTLRNAPTKISYGPLTSDAADLGEVFPEANDENFRNYDPVTTNLTGEETSYVWYLAPNRRGTGTASKAEDKDVMTAPAGQGGYCTHVSIRGQVTMAEGGTPREVIYNVYLGGNATNDYNLWANAAYSARLAITGFNEEQIEVGYDGFGITVAPLDGTADNTILGWHPDTGLEYTPVFLAFAPERIDFGDAESPGDQTVTFRVNSAWRFSYTSGDRTRVVASSSAEADADQTGGTQGADVECAVTFIPVEYVGQNGTPAAGTYSTVATFSTVGGDAADTRTVELLRTVPAVYGEPSLSPSSGSLPRAGATVTATLASNARWSFSADPGTTVTQEAGEWASRSLELPVDANDSWSSRTIRFTVRCGDKTNEWTLTQAPISAVAEMVSALPEKIDATGGAYQVKITGDFPAAGIGVRVRSGAEIFAKGTARTSGEAVSLVVPANGTGASRAVVFEYEKDGEWTKIAECPQETGLYVGALYGGGVVYGIGDGYVDVVARNADKKTYDNSVADCAGRTDGNVAAGTWALIGEAGISAVYGVKSTVLPLLESGDLTGQWPFGRSADGRQ